MTINQYLKMAKDAGKLDDYTKRYNEISRKANVIWYKLLDTGHFVLHFKIPSEKKKFVMYDTLIEFETSNINALAIKRANIKVFSNCPSYVFMNAKWANENGLAVQWSNDLFNKQTLDPVYTEEEQAARAKKEPQTSLKIERGLFFPILHVSKMTNTILTTSATTAIPIPSGALLTKFIKSADWVLEKRGQQSSLEKLQQAMKQFDPFKKSKSAKPKDAASPYVKSISKTGKIGSVKKTKKI